MEKQEQTDRQQTVRQKKKIDNSNHTFHNDDTEDEGREYVKRRNEINELNQKQERRWRDFTAFSALKMK